MSASNKSPKGSVGVEQFQGRLRLCLPRSLFGGEQKRLVLGLSDTPENRKVAEVRARQIELDVASGNFDPTLDKYRTKTHLSVVKQPTKTFNLLQVWDKYIEFKKASVSPSYLANQLQATRNHLNKLPVYGESDAVAVRDWAVANLTADSAKRFITQLCACCNWAVKSKLIDANPFVAMASEIKLPRSEKVDAEDSEINPFTAEERDRIIEAFRTDKFCHNCTSKNSKHSNYTAYVRFLFFTGCRPSEAIGLRWKHVDLERSTILFEEAAVQSKQGVARKKGLKTQAFRRFKINGQLREILLSVKSKKINPDDLVFPAPEGGFIIQGNFRGRVWKKVLQGLGIEYRVPYQTRHTFITLCLDKGIDVKDVARWVGNSPEVIYKHYAGNRRDLQVPEI
jgi:integrase